MKKLGNIFSVRVRLILSFVLMVTLLAMTQIKQSDQVCNSVVITISNNTGNHFLDENDVMAIANDRGHEMIEGQEIENIDLKGIEQRLNDNPYINSGQIFKDLQANLIISVDLKRPVARIIRSSAMDLYITEKGDLMPVSNDFVSRVMLVSGSFADSLDSKHTMAGTIGKEYMDVIDHIINDEFLGAQIAEMKVNRKGQIELIPQVTKQVIEFGGPDQIETKFKKLKIFYKEVLPREGWNKYERVNLEFDKQIIAE